MSRRDYRTSIPAEAAEVIDAHYSSGAKKSAVYLVGGKQVGRREWYENGELEYEAAYRDGVRHGHEYRFYENNQLLEKETYRDGTLHGVGKQWAEDGRLLVTWKLTDGVGLDLWCDTETETLAEEHYWPAEGELGYTRWWNEDEQTVWQEYFFLPGKGYHGVWREWNEQRRMRRGFPRYFVADVRVTKRQYLRACETDSMLPAYRPEDDAPFRQLPAEFVEQKKRRSRQ